LDDAIELALYMKKNRIRPEQVQDFYPTPGTLSTCMYYTGIDPRDGKSIYIPRNPQEKEMQRALMQYFMPKNRQLVLKALKAAGREDLIGFNEGCLISPRDISRERTSGKERARNNDGGKRTMVSDRKAALSKRRAGSSVRKAKHPGK